MAIANPLLYNAALAGFIGGAIAGQQLTSVTSAQYNTLVAAGVAFATEVDSKIAADVAATPQPAGSQAITVGATSIAPTTGPIIEGEVGKSGFMKAICFGVMFQRYSLDATAADYSALAAAAAVLYLNVALATNASYA